MKQEYTAQEFVAQLARRLKNDKIVASPQWAAFVKTGVHKERPPISKDWWYERSASVLRRVALLGPIGISKMRTSYGGRKSRGHKPEHFYKGSGKILRTVVQQLEEAQLIKQGRAGGHKGRLVTPKGQKLLASIGKNG